MLFPSTLTPGRLIKRYKRFLADIETDSKIITAHCPNTGSMRSCSTPGSRVYLSLSRNDKRKYPYTLEMVEDNQTWVGVNTARTNDLVAEAILNGKIKELAGADRLQREVRTSPHSRLDLALTHGKQVTYVEVKNCSLAQNSTAMFPDAVTSRGAKHLQELQGLVRQGHAACILFLVQRMDADRFLPANHIDPDYGRGLAEAAAGGVQVLVYQAEVTPIGIEVVRSLPWSLS
jgi:sugar fermentation stimulation protein A